MHKNYMQTGLTVRLGHVLTVFLRTQQRRHSCLLLKHVCASPVNGGTGNKGSNIPSITTKWLPPSTTQQRNTQTTIAISKKIIFELISNCDIPNLLLSIPWTNTTSALVMLGSLYNRPTNLKKSWTDHSPPLPHSLLKTEGHLSSVLLSLPPRHYRLSLTFSRIHWREGPLYLLELKHRILTVQWRTTLLSQPSKRMDGICYFASMTLSLDTTFTYSTRKLHRYLNACTLNNFSFLERWTGQLKPKEFPDYPKYLIQTNSTDKQGIFKTL